ncbi:hypothetical protein [Sphingobacterium sp. GVS05A]|jgi:hypothetical protein|uniref:hypothetical protein n=1 Tax=Sphingobacterium TaxID=28453 RepID=UPI001CBDB616|nr:hypothetical protein [Sphingobacterium sp. GVS05A]
MKIIIQNMVSRRCKMMVKSELDKLGIAYTSIELGEVRLAQPISENIKLKLRQGLHQSGLELLLALKKKVSIATPSRIVCDF